MVRVRVNLDPNPNPNQPTCVVLRCMRCAVVRLWVGGQVLVRAGVKVKMRVVLMTAKERERLHDTDSIFIFSCWLQRVSAFLCSQRGKLSKKGVVLTTAFSPHRFAMPRTSPG